MIFEHDTLSVDPIFVSFVLFVVIKIKPTVADRSRLRLKTDY